MMNSVPPTTSVPKAAGSTRERLSRDARRAQILAVATELFQQRSPEEVSLDEIADRLGCTRTLINHHFGSKRELYLEVIRGALSAEQVPVPDYVHGETMEERASRSLNGWFDVVESSPGVFLAAIRANGFADDEVARIAEQSREDIAAAFIQVLGLGPVDQLTPYEMGTVRAWAGLGEAAVVQWIEYGRMTRDQVHDLTIGTIVPGATQMLQARMGL